MNNKLLSQSEQDNIINILHARFEQNKKRHRSIQWKDVYKKLIEKPDKLWSLYQMEQTGGEPDVVAIDKAPKTFSFYDCSKESPSERRSLCYDRAAWEARKQHKPASNVIDIAASMGISLLTETAYRLLQQLGEFDLKTSSWILTPDPIRSLGGALFCDRRYDTVFVYHNGADSYYAARGFRGKLDV